MAEGGSLEIRSVSGCKLYEQEINLLLKIVSFPHLPATVRNPSFVRANSLPLSHAHTPLL
jgi:hypothetical protein